jgi:hypothetical protein
MSFRGWTCSTMAERLVMAEASIKAGGVWVPKCPPNHRAKQQLGRGRVFDATAKKFHRASERCDAVRQRYIGCMAARRRKGVGEWVGMARAPTATETDIRKAEEGWQMTVWPI